MTRKKKETKKPRKSGGAILKPGDNIEYDKFLERLETKPIKQHMKKLGATGTVTIHDFFTDAIVDKLIEESIDELEQEVSEE